MAESQHNFLLGLSDVQAHVFTATEEERRLAKQIACSADERCRTLHQDTVESEGLAIHHIVIKFSDSETLRDFRNRFIDWCEEQSNPVFVFPEMSDLSCLKREVAGALRMN